MTDVRVKRIRLAVHATDAAIGVEALREAEALLPEILEKLAAGLGDELIVLKKVEVGLLLQKLGGGARDPTIGEALRHRGGKLQRRALDVVGVVSTRDAR